MKRCSILLASMLAFTLSGCDDSDGVKPGQTHKPRAEVEQREEADGGASTGLTLRDRVDSFERSAQDIRERIDDGANAPELEQKARQLTNKAAPILDDFAKANPDCMDYLSQTKGLVGMLGNISEADIRRRYHQEEALPDAPGKCSRAKNLLVRPATMVVMLKNRTSREALASESEKLLSDISSLKNHF